MSTSSTAPVREIQAEFGIVEVGWNGEPLTGAAVAIDTESEMIAGPDHVPRLALLSASDGRRHVIVGPDQVEAFLAAHGHQTWIAHNWAFDFWGLQQHLDGSELLWAKAAAGDLRDSMLLARLLNIAEHGDPYVATNWPDVKLETLASALTDVRLDKHADAKYREHYAELIGIDWSTVEDEGWFVYPARDAFATLKVYAALHRRALAITSAHGVDQDVFDRWGPLSEMIQVQGAIALADIERRGLWVDGDRLAQLRQEHAERIRELAEQLEQTVNDDAELASIGSPLKHGDEGRILLSDTGGPRHDQSRLQKLFIQLMDRIEKQMGQCPQIPKQAKGQGLSTSADHWGRYADQHPFLARWFELGKLVKLNQALPGPVERVHPRYAVLTRTGRTACSKPNIQNQPREGHIREIYRPSADHVLMAADYKALELRTLAQHCLSRFGFSDLADAFDQGKDPHRMTAASVMDLTEEQFAQLPEDKQKEARQQAKAANFGFPGGLGAASFVQYARNSYGVELTEAEARQLRDGFLDTYGEVGRFLDDDDMAILAANLHCSAHALWHALDFTNERPGWMPHTVRRIISGESFKKSGAPYNPDWLDRVWGTLARLNRNPELAVPLRNRRGSGSLAARLFQRPATTLTGRIRGRCSYTEAHNVVFQGLAADGAKLALFELVRRGWRVVAFVHDEVLVEVEEGTDYAEAGRQLVEIMCEQMARVVSDVPIICDDAVPMRRWSKDAELIRDATGQIVPWAPTDEGQDGPDHEDDPPKGEDHDA